MHCHCKWINHSWTYWTTGQYKWVGKRKEVQSMLKQSSSDGSICAENKQTPLVFPLFLFTFFSTDAMQWYVMFGSSEAGHHCLWRLTASVLITGWGPWINAWLFLKGTQRQRIPSRNKRGENMMLSKKVHLLQNMYTIYSTMATVQKQTDHPAKL